MKRRILAAIFTLLFAGACTSSGGGGNGACDQFVGAKKARCESGMSDVKNAVDQLGG